MGGQNTYTCQGRAILSLQESYFQQDGPERFAGACSFAAGASSAGLLLPALFTDNNTLPPFRILATGLVPTPSRR